MDTRPYSPDFPNLIRIPARSYAATLELAGATQSESVTRLILMDIMVKVAVDQAGATLGFRAPETIFVDDVKDRLGYSDENQLDEETSAVIDKATLILRGQMQPNPIWDTDTVAA